MPIENAPSGFSAIGTDGWPILAAHRRQLEHQAVGFQARDDDLHRLCRQVRQARDFRLRLRAVQTDRLEHHALVELAHAHVVGAARTQPADHVGGCHGASSCASTPFLNRKLANGCISPVCTMA